MVALKFIHIAALALWVAGLVYLVALLRSHGQVRDRQDFARIRLASRFAYMGVASPGAMIAVGAGAALLFVADALHPWMVLKLMAVGVLVIAHLQIGFALADLAEPEEAPPTLRLNLAAGAVLASSLAILFLVLAKPAVPTGLLPVWLSSPGLLNPPESEARDARPRSPPPTT